MKQSSARKMLLDMFFCVCLDLPSERQYSTVCWKGFELDELCDWNPKPNFLGSHTPIAAMNLIKYTTALQILRLFSPQKWNNLQ